MRIPESPDLIRLDTMRITEAPDLITIGHVLTDIRIFVDEFPKPDEEARASKLSIGGGGSAANVAAGASRLGVKSGFIGTIGCGTFGRILFEELRQEGIDLSHAKIDTEDNSGLTLIAVNKRGQVMMFGYIGASDKLFPSDLNRRYISSAEHLHITGLSFKTALAAARMARKARVVVSFDPGKLMSRLGLKKISTILRYVDQILLNSEEAEELTGEGKPEEAAKILIEAGPKVAIMKKGAEGVLAVTSNDKFSFPAYPVKVVDTTGAGDAFSAGFITAQLECKDLESSVKFANATANLKVTREGARALPSRKDVEKFLRTQK